MVSSQVLIQPIFRRLLRGPLELVDLLERGLADLLRQVGGLDAGPVVVLLGPVAVAGQLLELLAHGGELLAEQELLLLLLHALGDVLADRLGDVKLGQVLSRPLDRGLEALGDVGRLEQLELLLGGHVAAVAGPVGDRRRVVELLDHVHDLPLAPLLEDGDDQGLVLLGELGRPGALPGLLDHRALNPERCARAGGAVADLHPGNPAQHRAGLAAGHPPDLLDHGQRAGAGQPAGDPRHEEHLGLLFRTYSWPPAKPRAVASGVDGASDLGVGKFNGDHHARQDHFVIERQHRQRERFAHQPS